MSNKVLLKKSSVALKVPTTSDLDYGELAINYADERLYFKNSSNEIKSFSTSGVSLEPLTIGTGLIGGSYNGISPITIALADTAVTPGSYGSQTQIPVITVDQQGRVTAASTSSISVGDGTLTLATSGIATGSQTFTANQDTNATFTVNVPGTNIAQGTRTTTTVPITSSTGTGATLSAASTTLAGVMTSADKTKLDGIAAGAQVNVATNLGITAGTTAGPIVTSSTGTNATLPTASATASGVVTTGAQTWAGVKTFSSTITGSITGNAGTATTLQTARTINGVSFNGSANITVADATKLPLAGGTMTGNLSINDASLFVGRPVSDTASMIGTNTTLTVSSLGVDQTAAQTNVMRLMRDGTGGVVYAGAVDFDMYRHTASGVSPNVGLVIKLSTTDTSTYYNALTIESNGIIKTGTNNIFHDGYHPNADVLTTARTIGGVSFNGSANINLPGVNTTGNQNTTGSAATLTTGRTIGMTGDVTWTSAAFNGSANVTGTSTLANSGVTAGTYTKITVDAKGRATSGTSLVASDIPNLDASKITSGIIDAARLPSFVDDVLEFDDLASFPVTGETGKIYVALDTNKVYRWSGTTYIFITSGAVDSVAGKTGVVTLVKGDVGLGNVDNTADSAKSVLEATRLTTGRTIGMTGDVSWTSAAFNGTGNVTGTSTLSNSGVTAGTYTAATVVVDAKGRVTSASSNTIPTVGNGTLTLATSGIATGSQTFTANQSTAATFTVNVPGTNIAEGTRTTTTVPITSSTGTNATLSAATTTLAGVMTSADKTKLDGIAAGAQVNVATNLTYSTAATTGTVNSSTGTNATIPAATTTLAGLMTNADKTKLDGIEAGAQVNVATNLGITAGTTAGPIVTSSTGTNATLPTASATASGVVTTGAQTWAGVKTFNSTIAGSITGNAGTATTLQTARTISLTGDVTGSVSFNGSANVSIAATIAANSVALGTDTTGNYVAGITAGGGIVVSGTAGEGWSPTVSHADTSSQASVDNSNGTVIQDITLDTYGHITAIGSVNLDGRYYTETEADGRFVNVTGDTMSGDLTINGTLSATAKSFLIPHPTKEGKKLRHGSLEGPEHGVYVRGKVKGKVIELPEYWIKLVDPDSITVQLTAIGKEQKLYVKDIKDNKVFIELAGIFSGEPHCFYLIQAERADIDKMQVESE